MSSIASKQLALLHRMASLDPPPFIMGGYAEDALLAGTVTRPHGDIDWLVPRSDLELRLEQARRLGFESLETWGEAAPGVPFYLSGDSGDQRLEVGILDDAESALWMRVHKLFFDLDGREPPAGYRVRMPPDTFTHPPVEIDGLPIRVASPLALYQLRAGIASRGSFGPLSDRHVRVQEQLRGTFFPGVAERDLTPEIAPLDSSPGHSSPSA